MQQMAKFPYNNQTGKFFWERGEYPKNADGSYQNFSSLNPPCDYDGSKMWAAGTELKWTNSSSKLKEEYYNIHEYVLVSDTNQMIFDIFNLANEAEIV